MPKKDLKDFFDATKNQENGEYSNLENQRNAFRRKLFLNKWFLIIIVILLALICVLSQGISF